MRLIALLVSCICCAISTGAYSVANEKPEHYFVENDEILVFGAVVCTNDTYLEKILTLQQQSYISAYRELRLRNKEIDTYGNSACGIPPLWKPLKVRMIATIKQFEVMMYGGQTTTLYMTAIVFFDQATQQWLGAFAAIDRPVISEAKATEIPI